jgi:hypothetical protein
LRRGLLHLRARGWKWLCRGSHSSRLQSLRSSGGRVRRPRAARRYSRRRGRLRLPIRGTSTTFDLVAGEIGAHSDDIAQGNRPPFRQLLCSLLDERQLRSRHGGIFRAARDLSSPRPRLPPAESGPGSLHPPQREGFVSGDFS